MTATAFAHATIDAADASLAEPLVAGPPHANDGLSPATALQRRIEESILAGFFDKQPVCTRTRSRRATALTIAFPFVAWGVALMILALVGR